MALYTVNRLRRPGYRYAFEDLPADVQSGIREYYGELPEPEDISEELRELHGAQPWALALAQEREIIVKALQRRLAEKEGSKIGKTKLVKQFAEEFNKQRVPGLGPEIYEHIKHVKSRTLRTWLKNYSKKRLAGLISRRGQNRDRTSIPPEQQQRIRVIMVNSPHYGPRRIATILKAEFGDLAAGVWTVRRFMNSEKASDPGFYAFCESPDRWKSKFQPAFGDASAKATHFLHYVEMDSTPADVICNDGNRYTIIGLIDICTRRAMYKVFPTSNRWGVLAVLEAAVSEWGIPENIIMDRGKDFQSKDVRCALENLEARGVRLPPFTPEGKPHIERMMKTLAQGLEEVLAGYEGHNVADKQMLRSRRRFAARLCTDGETVEVDLSPKQLDGEVARWLRNVYSHRPHKGLGGMSPNQKYASIPHRPRRVKSREQLMMLLIRGEERVMQKDGLHYAGGVYCHDNLAPFAGKKFVCRQYPWNIGLLCVSTPKPEKFVCWAKDASRGGITAAEAIRAKRRETKRINEKRRAFLTLGRENYTDPRAEERALARERSAKVHPLDSGGPLLKSPLADMAYAAGEDLKEQREAEAPIFEAETVTPEPELGLPDDPKVVGLPRRDGRASYGAEPEPLRFANCNDLLDHMLAKWRKGGLDLEEETRLRQTMPHWTRYAQLRIDTLPRGDQAFLARIAPELFGEYAEDEAAGDSH